VFLKKQLALYAERQVKPRRADDATRITLVALSRLVEWRRILTIVQPATLIRWHRNAYRLFWRLKSQPRGRPPVPATVRQLIVDMASANLDDCVQRTVPPTIIFVIRLATDAVRQNLANCFGCAPRPYFEKLITQPTEFFILAFMSAKHLCVLSIR